MGSSFFKQFCPTRVMSWRFEMVWTKVWWFDGFLTGNQPGAFPPRKNRKKHICHSFFVLKIVRSYFRVVSWWHSRWFHVFLLIRKLGFSMELGKKVARVFMSTWSRVLFLKRSFTLGKLGKETNMISIKWTEWIWSWLSLILERYGGYLRNIMRTWCCIIIQETIHVSVNTWCAIWVSPQSINGTPCINNPVLSTISRKFLSSW